MIHNRILAVDDDAAVLEFLQELLEEECIFQAACSGEQALSKIDAFRPDLILLDVRMPGMDGYETCRRLRSATAQCEPRVIMLSARDEGKARLAAYDAGADDYLTKPFENAELTAKLRAWLRGRGEPLDASLEYIELLRDALGMALTTVVGFHRVESPEHLFRVRWYSLQIAEALQCSSRYSQQLSEVFIRNIYRTSPLHDIGMLAVREEIVAKPAKLDLHEWDEVKKHTYVGAALLERALAHGRDAKLAATAANIARHHHERFDGRGYPARLVGEAIPLEARIVAVADAFDALTSERPYRTAFSAEQAVAMIERESGSHFDPAIVNAFQQRFDDLVPVMRKISVCSLTMPLDGSSSFQDCPSIE
jgi:putative two-component system response regulator